MSRAGAPRPRPTWGQAAALGVTGLILALVVATLLPWFGLWVADAGLPPATARYPYNDYGAEGTIVRLLDTPDRARLFDPAMQLAWQQEVWGPRLPPVLKQPFVRVPWTVLLLWPLAQVPHAVGFLLLTALNVGLAGLALIAWVRWARLPPWVGLAFVCGALGSFAMLRNVTLGQHSAWMFATLSACVLWSLRGADTRAGLALAAATLKPHLIMLIPLAWLLQGRWRALAAGAAGLAALAAVSLLLLGPPTFLDFIAIQGTYEQYFPGAEATNQMQNWRGLIETLLGRSGPAPIILTALAMLGVALAVAAVWWPPGRATRPATDLRWAATVLGSLLFSQHTHLNDLLAWAIPVAIVLRRVYAPPPGGAFTARQRGVALAGAWGAYFVLPVAWIVQDWRLGLWVPLVALALLAWRIRREERGLGVGGWGLEAPAANSNPPAPGA
jgi:hypothetical protein